VWNLEPAQTTNIVDVYVNYLRRKLEDPPPGRLIRTVRGRGYMVPPETELSPPAPHSADLVIAVPVSSTEIPSTPPAAAAH
jgi:DNA-binding winged helix-turn-helix (wHTH) protein